MKNIKIAEDAHEALADFCPKSKTYGECILELLSGEPFVSRLKEVLPRTIERVETAKKGERHDLSMADDLVRVCEWIIDTSEVRSGARKRAYREKLAEITREERKLIALLKSKSIDKEEIVKRLSEIADALEALPRAKWATDEKGNWILEEVSK